MTLGILYQTPTMQIDDTIWRLIVYRHPAYGPCTRYEFQVSGHWRPQTEWPTYNSDDGKYAGLPRSLRRLFFDHQTKVEAALIDAPRLI
jgi:hypothetical protein